MDGRLFCWTRGCSWKREWICAATKWTLAGHVLYGQAKIPLINVLFPLEELWRITFQVKRAQTKTAGECTHFSWNCIIIHWCFHVLVSNEFKMDILRNVSRVKNIGWKTRGAMHEIGLINRIISSSYFQTVVFATWCVYNVKLVSPPPPQICGLYRLCSIM